MLPRDAEDAVALLLTARHHRRAPHRPATLEVQAYTVADVEHERQYNHAAVTRIQVGEVITQTR